jgi:hypothetical protein
MSTKIVTETVATAGLGIWFESQPEELRAINAVDDALVRGAVRRYQDLIIALALSTEVKCS